MVRHTEWLLLESRYEQSFLSFAGLGVTRDRSCHLGDKSIACQAPVVRGAVSGLVPIRSAAVTVAPGLPCLTVVLMLLFVFLCLTSGSCRSSGLPSALLSVATPDRRKVDSVASHYHYLNSRCYRPKGRSCVPAVASEQSSSGPIRPTP